MSKLALGIAVLLSILAVAARLILINQPYIDTWSWRQSDVATIALNYFQNGYHFPWPQIDWAGSEPGYVGTEFPILPFVAAVAYKSLGVRDWIGRVETVILFAVSLPFFFLLVRELFGATAAAWALLFYGFAPLNLFAGREFMPDVPSLSVSLVGLYLFKRWLDRQALGLLLCSALAISLSILIKAPSAVTAAALACLAFQRLSQPPLRLGAVFQRLSIWLLAAIALVPAAVWYWHAYSVAQNFYPHHFFGGGGVRIESASAYERIAVFTVTSSLTPILVILALAGLALTRSTINARPFRWWLGAMLIFIIVAGKGNRHPWYQLPLVPIGAAFAGAACAFVAEKVPDRRTRAILSVALAFTFCGAAFYYVRPFYRSWATHLRDAGLELRRVTPPTSLIVAADHGDPTLFYYAGRRGWHLPQKEAIYYGDPADGEQLIDNLAQLRKAGATHLAFVSTTFWFIDRYPDFAAYLAQSATLMEKTSEFAIYQLNPNQ
jgi:4-amino-4-deoxy-L-arabinose transferase-like glycosyltransferase